MRCVYLIVFPAFLVILLCQALSAAEQREVKKGNFLRPNRFLRLIYGKYLEKACRHFLAFEPLFGTGLTGRLNRGRVIERKRIGFIIHLTGETFGVY